MTLRHGVLDECYSGIPRTPAGSLVLGDGSPSIPAFALYTLHPTPYTGVPTICHVHGGGSPCLPCFRVNPCSSVGGISPCHPLCFASGNILDFPLYLLLVVLPARNLNCGRMLIAAKYCRYCRRLAFPSVCLWSRIHSGIPFAPVAGLILGDGSPRIPASTLYALHFMLHTPHLKNHPNQ